jgi:hypothetical protein
MKRKKTVPQILRQSKRDFEKFRHEIESGGEQRIFVTEAPLMDFLLSDHLYQRSVVEMVAVAMQSFMDPTAEPRECFGCRKPWAWDRSIDTVVLVEFPNLKSKVAPGIVAGMCSDCAGHNAVLIAACKRDFGSDNMQAVHQMAGHA